MSDHPGEKTLEPTPHRLQQARLEGHVAKSRDLGSAVMLLAGLAALVTLGGGLVATSIEFCREQLGGNFQLTINPQSVVDQWQNIAWRFGRSVLPILGLLFAAAVAINVLQVGFLFLPKRLAMDLSQLDPLQGLRRIFSPAGLVQCGFGMVKLVVIVVVGALVLYDRRETIVRLAAYPPGEIAAQVAELFWAAAVRIGAALFVLALLDYAYQWHRHRQDLKMTPQELREELRNLETNPQMVARRKQAQRDLALQRVRHLPPV
jgi:flagellar biosynthesis protein FlhB